MDPSSIAVSKIKAEEKQKELTKELEEAQKALETIKNSEEYKNLETEIADLEKKVPDGCRIAILAISEIASPRSTSVFRRST